MIPLWKRIHRGGKQREKWDGLLHSQTHSTHRSLASLILEQPPCSVKNNQLFIWLTRQTGALREYYLSGVCSTTRQTENTHTHTHTHTYIYTHTHTHADKQIKEDQAGQIWDNIGMQILHEGDRTDRITFINHWATFLAILFLLRVRVLYSLWQSDSLHLKFVAFTLRFEHIFSPNHWQRKCVFSRRNFDTWSYTMVARVKAKTKWCG